MDFSLHLTSPALTWKRYCYENFILAKQIKDGVCIYIYIYSNLYKEVTFGTKKKWYFKTGDPLKEVQFI